LSANFEDDGWPLIPKSGTKKKAHLVARIQPQTPYHRLLAWLVGHVALALGGGGDG
jgi:hypothetical protein